MAEEKRVKAPMEREFLQNLADVHAVSAQNQWAFAPWNEPTCIHKPGESAWGVNKVVFKLKRKPGVPRSPTCARCKRHMSIGQVVVWYRQGRFFLHPICDAKTRRKGDQEDSVQKRLKTVELLKKEKLGMERSIAATIRVEDKKIREKARSKRRMAEKAERENDGV